MYGSCSFAWLNTLYILGGSNQQRQVSRLEGCHLSRVGNLPFNLKFGTCATIDSRAIVACFDTSNKRSQVRACHITTDPLDTWLALPKSTFNHRGIKIAATTSEILAVGSLWPSHAKSETMMGTQWSIEDDYPFSPDISEAAVISKGNHFFLFGGWSERSSKGFLSAMTTIAKFDGITRQWSSVGNMNTPRHGHGVITMNSNSAFMLVGGVGNVPIEKCTDHGNNVISCEDTNASLHNYEHYPALFIVDTDFCLGQP